MLSPEHGRKFTVRSHTRVTVIVTVLAWTVTGMANGPAGAQALLARELAKLPPVIGHPQTYQRKGKESIYRIARRFGVSAAAIHNANVGELTRGDELIIIPTERIAPLQVEEGIVVNLPERGLYFFHPGRPIRYYPITIGRPGWETPTGEFAIATKAKNPTWFPPEWAVEEEPVPPGPENPLGDRWMGLSVKGYGIHATNAPASIGRATSHGCMRMYPEQARDLFDRVPVKTPVTIIYERVVFGYDAQAGTVVMAYYPDPYEMGGIRPQDVRQWLGDYGLAEVADMEAIEQALERPAGVPVPVVGSPLQVLVNGRRIQFALGPVRVGEEWLVPVEPLLSALRGQVEIGAGGGYLIIVRGENRLFLVPGSTEALLNGQSVTLTPPPKLAAGYPLIPLKSVLSLLNGSVGWDEQQQAILIWDGWSRIPDGTVLPTQ